MRCFTTFFYPRLTQRPKLFPSLLARRSFARYHDDIDRSNTAYWRHSHNFPTWLSKYRFYHYGWKSVALVFVIRFSNDITRLAVSLWLYRSRERNGLTVHIDSSVCSFGKWVNRLGGILLLFIFVGGLLKELSRCRV